MKKVNLAKTIAGAGLIGAMAASAPAAYAASATTTVSIAFPTVLVMYHYSTINLDVADSAIADLISGAPAVPCTADFCDDLGNKDLTGTQITDFAGGATIDATISGDVSALATTSGTVTVQNAVGVRALGCSTYSATVTDPGSSAGITVDTVGSLSAIDTAPCSLALTTGDLAFDIDFATVAGNSADAVFDITVTGNI